MPNHRPIALTLSVILASFILTIMALSVQIYRQELSTGVLTSEKIDQLKIALAESPDDEKIIGEIREIDLKLRSAHALNRQRLEWAGYMAIIALAAWVASMRWLLSTYPPRKTPPMTAQLQDARRPKILRDRRLGLLTNVIVIAALFLTLFLIGALQTPKLPPLDWGKAVVEADTSPLDLDSTFLQNWPCFRGPDDLGIAGEGDWPTTWSLVAAPSADDAPTSTTEPIGDVNIAWKTEIPIFGNSSPVVWRNLIFLSGAVEPESEEAPVEFRVLCVDRVTGDILWNQAAEFPVVKGEEFEEPESGYAASTPATDGEHIIALFANGILVAFDYTGEQTWVRNFGIPDNAYGIANSLIIENHILFLQFDQGDDPDANLSKLYGIDTATGKTLFATERPVAGAWSSPSLIRTPERVELITCSDPLVIAYDPSNGQEYWRMDLLSADMAPSPTYGGGLLFVTSDQAELYAIKPGGQGDVTETQLAWSHDDGMPDVSSPVTDGKYVIQPASGGSLNCVSIERRETAWEWDWRTRDMGGAMASPILANGNIYVFCEDGSSWIFAMSGAYEHVGTGHVGEGVYATPAFVDSQIIVRGVKHLICIQATQ